MNFQRQISLVTLIALIGSSPLISQDKKSDSNPKVEFYFVEDEPVEGVTGDKKYQTESRTGYLHRKPALVLTTAHIEDVELRSQEFTFSDKVREYFIVQVTLTDNAREQIASKVIGKKMKLLTVVVDGKPMNLYRYEVDQSKKGVSKRSLAGNFNPSIGYFASKSEAERVYNFLD